MKPRYSFSAKHTRRARDKTASASREKFPDLLRQIVNKSDIIIEVLDARFPEETRNKEIEEEILKRGKKIIYVFNKSDLISKKIESKLKPFLYLSPKERQGSKKLRDQIKILSKRIENPVEENKIVIGVIGYPNTGKSSLINFLIGKNSAGTAPEAGYTKGIQKLKLAKGLFLLDSPGVIPKKEYSHIKMEAISKHAKVNARSYTQVKEPEIVVSDIMNEYSKQIQEFYKINVNDDAEELIEELGRKRGYLKKGGLVDEDKTARLILRDWQTGNIKI